MDRELQRELLSLNRDFYTLVAEPFDATRLAASPGKSELVRRLDLETLALSTSLPTVADIGCGNGRLAWLLDEQDVPLAYVGVDANAQLLAAAQAHTAELRHVRACFVQADLAETDWPGQVVKPKRAGSEGSEREGFDIVTCLATLHHLPGYDLRQRVVQQLAALVAPGGLVAISTWQFLTSPRFVAKLVEWAQVGIDASEVEPGDALLPWQQGAYAVRYVHQIDMDEVIQLATAAALTIESTYFADGKEGNLNLYTLLRRPYNQSQEWGERNQGDKA